MDPEQFDDIARSLGERRRATRRRALAALPALVLAAAAPGIVRAFDAGIPARTPAPGQVSCAGAADCPSGLVCIDGICAQIPVGGSLRDAPAVETPATTATGGATTDSLTPTPRAVTTPAADGADATVAAEQPAASPAADATVPAVGGPTIGDEPLPAGIYAGRCGALGAEAAFPLIDIGAEQANGAAPTPPAGAPEGAGSDFSTSVLSVDLAGLIATEYAIDVRTDPRDPATSIVCGDISGTVDPAAENPELVTPLDETNESGVTGVALLRGQGERTLAYTFVTRPGGGETATAAQAAGTPAPARPIAEGDALLTLIDVNLRSEPSTDAPVVEVLGTGAELQATGAASGGWVPVLEPVNGARGFVSEEFVEQAA